MLSHIDLKINSICNNCCIHCIESDERERLEKSSQAYESKTSEIIKKIAAFKKEGCKILTITGGEPTLRRDLLEIIKAANSLKIFTGVQTNARLVSYPEYARQISLSGVHFVVAVHGHNKEIHDSITRVNGSFDQTTKGILNLLNLKNSLSINTVISKKNAAHLMKIINEFYKIGVKNFNFVFPRIDKGNALLHFEEVIVKYSAIKDELLSILELASKDISIKFENIPPCILDGKFYFIKDYLLRGIESKMRQITLEERNWSHDKTHEIKTKLPQCRSCCYFQMCEGICKEYLKRFCPDEFVPCSGRL